MSDVDVRDAFPKLVDDYQDALYRFALRLTANPQDAEDIAQDAFVRAYRWLEAHGFRSVDTKPWLYRVTLNVFRNRVGKARLATAALEHALELPDGPAEQPSALAERGETRAELAQVLARLPLRYREAIVLRHVEELTYPEMAAVLKRPQGTIKSDVHRGLELLRAALAPVREEVLA
jgi:RNA polymerase sigma-70 factor (ECF subfamily)